MQDSTLVGSYMRRLEDLGGQTDHIGKFSIALHDEELIELEERLIEQGQGLALHDPVLALYNRWRQEMGPELWSEVIAANRAASDADRNWLVSEEMDGAVEAVV